MQFTLQNPGAVRGDQLADEIKQATGLNVRVSYLPPAAIEISDDLQGKQVQVAAIVAAHIPDPLYFQGEKDALLASTNETILRTKLEGAMANLQAYRGLATPTGAQTTATVKLLAGAVVWLIRIQLRKLDAVD